MAAPKYCLGVSGGHISSLELHLLISKSVCPENMSHCAHKGSPVPTLQNSSRKAVQGLHRPPSSSNTRPVVKGSEPLYRPLCFLIGLGFDP